MGKTHEKERSEPNDGLTGAILKAYRHPDRLDLPAKAARVYTDVRKHKTERDTMSDIDFKCPSCAQDLQAPTTMSGQTIDCPNCSKPLIIPSPQPSAQSTYTPPQKPKLTIPKGGLANATSRPQAEKPCPLCGESILAVAKKCKHCGSMLDGSPNTQNVTVTGKDPFAEYHTPIQGKKKGKLTVIGICGIGFGILAMGASIAGCLMESNPNAGEGILYMFLVGLGFTVASFLWARK